jgi:hypothetical protein
MTKAQLLFDPPAEREQFGLLPRGRNDLNAERLLIRLSRRRQGEHREADQRDDEGDGKIIEHVPAKGARGRRYPAGCRTDRDHIAETRRRSHRATEIGAVNERNHSGCDGDGRTARRATGRQRDVEGIARWSAKAISADCR